MNALKTALAPIAAQIHAEDIRKAEQLRKAANLPPRKPGTGPRIAR